MYIYIYIAPRTAPLGCLHQTIISISYAIYIYIYICIYIILHCNINIHIIICINYLYYTCMLYYVSCYNFN